MLAGYTLFIYLLTNVLSSRLSARAVYSLLAAGIIGCFTVFKYYGFMQESLQSALLQAGVEVELPVLSVLAPLGLSFYAFHSVSYVVSVCRKEIEKAPFGCGALSLLLPEHCRRPDKPRQSLYAASTGGLAGNY